MLGPTGDKTAKTQSACTIRSPLEIHILPFFLGREQNILRCVLHVRGKAASQGRTSEPVESWLPGSGEPASRAGVCSPQPGWESCFPECGGSLRRLVPVK